MAHSLRRRTLCLAAAGTALCDVSLAAKPDQREEHMFISDQVVYDDNLFRLADSETSPVDPTDPNAATRQFFREDYSNRLTLGLGNDFQLGQQSLKLRGRVYDVRYNDNDYLDYVGGDATGQFDFRILTSLSGRLTGGYNRSQADFAQTRGTAKDLLETFNYNAYLKLAIGPRWSISAGGGRVETEHELATRQQENLQADLGRVSLDYVTPTFHAITFEYQYMDATFPDAIQDPRGFSASDFEENRAVARFTYTATVHTQFRVSGGYVERERPGTDEGDYSGDIWRAEIDWKPREKFSTLFAAFRELRAYTDVESDYFISDGYSLSPTWSPTEKLIFALSVIYEDQEYISNRSIDIVDPSAPKRNDDLINGVFTFTYKPRDQLAIELTYRGSDRDSNRINRRFDAQTAGIALRWSVF